MIFVIFFFLWPARYFNDAWLASMQCVTWNLNLPFFHLLKTRVYPLSLFQLFLSCCFCKYFFVTHFLFVIFYLVKQHPISLEKPLGPIEWHLSSSPFFKSLCPRVCPCECGWIHEDPAFSDPAWCIQLYCADGWSTCGCLAVFPRHKCRTQFISSLFFSTVWWRWFLNRYIMRSTIIPELCRWLELFSQAVFVYSVRFHEITCL